MINKWLMCGQQGRGVEEGVRVSVELGPGEGLHRKTVNHGAKRSCRGFGTCKILEQEWLHFLFVVSSVRNSRKAWSWFLHAITLCQYSVPLWRYCG